MEVHAHTHTARKKWTHYLWEFLMLFLAVFCGFLAEYQLEHKIEKEKGMQYISSFYEECLPGCFPHKILKRQQRITSKIPRNNVSIFFFRYVSVHVLP